MASVAAWVVLGKTRLVRCVLGMTRMVGWLSLVTHGLGVHLLLRDGLLIVRHQ